MKLSTLLRRERTNVTTKSTITFNTPGIYYPPYGKTAFLLQGKGTPGNYSSGGNYAGTNTVPGNAVYVSESGGNTNVTPGNIDYNPSNPGTIKGTRNINYVGADGNYTYSWYSIGNYGYSLPPNALYTGPDGATLYDSYTYNSTNAPVPGNSYTNPPTPGGTNPYYPEYTYYNPTTPGEPYYNPYYPGYQGATNTVLGVTLPGGPADSAAPVIGYVSVGVTYSNSGVPISVPTGGYVSIQNT